MKLSVLFSSAGRRVELIECFRRAARDLDIPLRAIACDLSPELSAACFTADKSFAVPRCTDPDFIPALLSLCETERVSLLVPTIDTELEALAAAREPFRKIGTLIAVSSPEIVHIARNKVATHEFLIGAGLPSPRTAYLGSGEQQFRAWNYPVILKRIDGSSSIGIQICQSFEQLSRADVPRDNYIVQELCPGAEYTVNMFFDHERFRCAVPHRRLETRAGEVSKGITMKVPQLQLSASQLGTALEKRAFAALCFQAIISKTGQSHIFEINARFGGGYPLTDRAGGTFAKWLLEIVLGRDCTAKDEWQECVKMLRYDAAVFPNDRECSAIS